VLIVGVVAIGALAVVMLAGSRQSRPQVDPSVAFLLQRQQQQLNALERATYHQIAMQQRQRLPAGTGHQVIVRDK